MQDSTIFFSRARLSLLDNIFELYSFDLNFQSEINLLVHTFTRVTLAKISCITQSLSWSFDGGIWKWSAKWPLQKNTCVLFDGFPQFAETPCHKSWVLHHTFVPVSTWSLGECCITLSKQIVFGRITQKSIRVLVSDRQDHSPAPRFLLQSYTYCLVHLWKRVVKFLTARQMVLDPG